MFYSGPFSLRLFYLQDVLFPFTVKMTDNGSWVISSTECENSHGEGSGVSLSIWSKVPWRPGAEVHAGGLSHSTVWFL